MPGIIDYSGLNWYNIKAFNMCRQPVVDGVRSILVQTGWSGFLFIILN